MALENYRITEFQEKTQVDNGDYVLIDSATDGTHKYQLSRIPAQASAEVAAAVAAEETAREAADAAEVTARNAAIGAAISDEVTARNAAISANVDDTLTVSGKAADAKKTGDEIADLKSDLSNFNASDILRDISSPVSRTAADVTYTWTSKTHCNVSGTSTAEVTSSILAKGSTLPSGIIAGATYYLKYASTNANVFIRFIFYNSSDTAIATWTYYNDATITVPSEAASMACMLRTNSGVNCAASVDVYMLDVKTNKMLSEETTYLLNKVSTTESNLYHETVGVVKAVYTEGQYYNASGSSINVSSPTTDSRYASVYVRCNAGDKFLVRGNGNTSSTALWAFIDSSGNVLAKAATGTTTGARFQEIVAPTSSYYIVSNTLMSTGFGYALYKELSSYQSIHDCIATKFVEEDFDYGLINDTTFLVSVSGRNIYLKDFIASDVSAIINQDSNVRVAVYAYTPDGRGASVKKYVVTNEAYNFNHTTNKYRVVISYNGGSRKIISKSDVLQNIAVMVSSKSLINNRNRYFVKFNNQKDNLKLVQRNLETIMANNYDISFANAIKMGLVNCYGNTQNIHPKVLYFANGFSGHKYWMAYTPYPITQDAYENPCIAWSDDGYSWFDVSSNPIDDPSGVGYNSDTHLVYNSSTARLECWYRYVSTDTPIQERIYRRTSTNGVQWGSAELIYTDATGTYNKLLSPTIILSGSTYQIWVVDAASNCITYYTAPSTDITNWTKVRDITLTYSADGLTYKPWHMDMIVNSDNKYVLCMMAQCGSVWSVFLATSDDNITYNTPYPVILGSNDWDKKMYRSSIVQVGNEYLIYYSACTDAIEGGGAIWGMGITRSKTLNNFIGV